MEHGAGRGAGGAGPQGPQRRRRGGYTEHRTVSVRGQGGGGRLLAWAGRPPAAARDIALLGAGCGRAWAGRHRRAGYRCLAVHSRCGAASFGCAQQLRERGARGAAAVGPQARHRLRRRQGRRQRAQQLLFHRVQHLACGQQKRKQAGAVGGRGWDCLAAPCGGSRAQLVAHAALLPAADQAPLRPATTTPLAHPPMAGAECCTSRKPVERRMALRASSFSRLAAVVGLSPLPSPPSAPPAPLPPRSLSWRDSTWGGTKAGPAAARPPLPPSPRSAPEPRRGIMGMLMGMEVPWGREERKESRRKRVKCNGAGEAAACPCGGMRRRPRCRVQLHCGAPSAACTAAASSSCGSQAGAKPGSPGARRSGRRGRRQTQRRARRGAAQTPCPR